MEGMDASQEHKDIAVKVLADQVSALATEVRMKFSEANVKSDLLNAGINELRTSVAVINERTKTENQSNRNVSDTSWKWASIMVSIIALAVAAFAVIVHKS